VDSRRNVNGDDVVLDYNQAVRGRGTNSPASGLMFGSDGPIVQWVKLYRYQ